MKYIIAKINPESTVYGCCPYVVESTHGRFTNGTRFDYGFMQVALSQGYLVTVLPQDKNKQKLKELESEAK